MYYFFTFIIDWIESIFLPRLTWSHFFWSIEFVLYPNRTQPNMSTTQSLLDKKIGSDATSGISNSNSNSNSNSAGVARNVSTCIPILEQLVSKYSRFSLRQNRIWIHSKLLISCLLTLNCSCSFLKCDVSFVYK